VNNIDRSAAASGNQLAEIRRHCFVCRRATRCSLVLWILFCLAQIAAETYTYYYLGVRTKLKYW